MSDLMQIYTNTQAMHTRTSLMKVNEILSNHQYRLSTGKKINSASEDPAGYALARTLERRKRGLAVALQNSKNANSIMNVAEGGYQNIMDIIQIVKEKATQAADYSLNSAQRTALDDQVQALLLEVDEIVDDTTFNNMVLIDGSYSGDFQTGERYDDILSVSLSNADSVALGLNAIDLTTQSDARTAIQQASDAIDLLASAIQHVGEFKVRLNSKINALGTQETNTESVRSTIEDADFAAEQMEVVKNQILQQTSVTALTQANSAPQIVLSLIQ
ncbi:MAG: flagellin [Candidatus Marinimicrobia bacterium]|nr:flagellin [Candidatus Neomarinimicrobiota bacterium]